MTTSLVLDEPCGIPTSVDSGLGDTAAPDVTARRDVKKQRSWSSAASPVHPSVYIRDHHHYGGPSEAMAASTTIGRFSVVSTEDDITLRTQVTIGHFCFAVGLANFQQDTFVTMRHTSSAYTMRRTDLHNIF